MKVVLSWLRECCPVDLSAEKLGELLDGKGMHVESIDRPWEGLDGVVVARVLEVREHPDSDKLCLTRIDLGGAEREVVVGVRNMSAGDLVPYAGPGSRVPALPERISTREIRGVASEGMLASARELAISADHTGILVLAPDVEVGADVKAAMGLDDAVLDLEIETNRPDLLSVFGIAREVAAATGLPLTPPDASVEEADQDAAAVVSVEIEDRTRCPRYLARVIADVEIRPSPPRMQARLTAAGMRPVSNIVDATNYVMLELGQPMHPFDLERLDGRGIVVRRARPGERLFTLDDIEREVTEDDLLIADHAEAVGIAGVMGSASAEVFDGTTQVLLESAYFESRAILRTSRRLMLPTEASTRFSRGTDPEGVGPAADRAARLIVEWGGGTVLRGAIDVGGPPARRRIKVRPARASLLIGHEVSASDVADALERIGIATEKVDDDVVTEAPSFRPDLEREEDLIEEIARVQGYENLRATLPGIRQAGGPAPEHAFRRRVREACVGSGLREALSLTFAAAADLELMGHEGAIAVANPPSADQPFLRRSLVPGLVRALARTMSRGARGVALFEIGHVFHPSDPVDEREMVSLVMAGPAEDGLYGDGRVFDFFDAKGAFEGLMRNLSIEGWSLTHPLGRPFHPGRSARVSIGDDASAGVIGELDPSVTGRLDLPGRVAVAELDTRILAEHARKGTTYRDVPRFPPVRRDLAFTIDATVPAADVRSTLEEAGGDLVGSASLFDVFEGDPLPAGTRSLAFSVDVRATDRTLTDQEADGVVAAIVDRLARDFGAELRAG
ncbi:MAG TPA: phenylalanine--tRNA ligase subunit beta [Actinomycetota bacterium]|nr:phenylalanine--tRNA ligase subunit beta [Actinomycetota bacterium]